MGQQADERDGARVSVGGEPMDFSDMILEGFMAQNHRKYITYQEVEIMCITFNVNTKSPRDDLFDLFHPPPPLKHPKVYAICLQEMDLGTEALLRSSGVTNREQEWLNEFSRHLGYNYVRVSRQRLLGIALFLYAAKDCLSRVSLLGENCLATGLMGIIGNKGGVSSTLLFDSTTLVFVGAHFPAHDQNVVERNQNFLDISRHCVPPCDIVFWLGDLNYRLGSVSNEHARAQIRANRVEGLLQHDQLGQQQRSGQIFADYIEPPIEFPPTYKFDSGTDHYDTSSKMRVPAWTDRILFCHRVNNPIRCLHYSHVPRIRFSDHRPVRGYFSALVGSINPAREAELMDKFYAATNKFELMMQPRALLSANELHFGEVSFMEFAERTVTLSNVGDCEIKFDIINVIESDGRGHLSTSWLTIEPHSHTLPPEREVGVHFSIYVKDLPTFNRGDRSLTETVVVRLFNGSHHFISLDATLRPTCFGGSITARDSTDSPDSPSDCPLPMELYHMIDALVERCPPATIDWLPVDDVQASEISRIIRIVDGCYPMSELHCPEVTPSALFLSILLFIGSLSDPLIPDIYRDYVIENLTMENAKEIVELLPFPNRCCFVYLMAFFRYISSCGDDSEKRILSSKIQSAMFRISDCHDVAQGHKRYMFVMCFLTMPDSAFKQICAPFADF